MYLIQLVSVLAALALSCPLVEAEPVARQNAARSKNGVEVRQGRQRSGWPIGTVANIPVKRDVDHAERSRKRELRRQQHSQALDNYFRNIADAEFMSKHKALLDSAKGMEQASLRRRAGTEGSSAPMQDYFDGNVDILYTVDVGVGTPAQQFNIVPDTGSADFWVPYYKADDPGHNLFNTSASSTLNVTDTAFDDQYGLGEAYGTVVSDTVTMAGYTIQNKLFGVATELDSQFQNQPNDGLMGMCSSVLANMSTPTFFETLINTSAIANPYFSTYLTRGRDTTNQQSIISGSSICIGCIATPPSSVQVSGDLTYVPITLFAFYEVQLDSISYDGAVITGTSTLAMMDTGTTDIYLPTAVADAMMDKVSGRRQRDGSFLVPASAITTTTQFAFTFSGNTYTVNILDLIDGYNDNSRTEFIMSVYADDTTDPNGANLAILGDSFLKNVLTVYSYSTNGKPAVGLQQLSSSSNLSSVATTAAGGSTTRVPGIPTGTGRTTQTGSALATSAGVSAGMAVGMDGRVVLSAVAMLVGVGLGALVV